MTYLLLVLAGALLVNAVPHLAAGLRGEAFPTPFARPPGEGPSAPIINVVWGSANLFGGAALLIAWLPGAAAWPALASVALGWIAMAVYLARHFGAVRGRSG